MALCSPRPLHCKRDTLSALYKWVRLARLTLALVSNVLTTSADTLDIADGKGMIVAPNVYAALRGMFVMMCILCMKAMNNISTQLLFFFLGFETFSQLVYRNLDDAGRFLISQWYYECVAANKAIKSFGWN